jgi:hypothetical protein
MGKRLSYANRTIYYAIAAIVVVFALFTGGLWRAHFFTSTGSDASDKLVAEALTFVGGLVAAIVSILGVLLKYSIDKQAEERARMEADRAVASKKIEEKRLQMEAAIRAVQLLATNDGKESPPIQQAGALFALASLDQHELTMQLTAKLLQQSKVDAGTASNLVDSALRYAIRPEQEKFRDHQDSLDIQSDAVDLLMRNAGLLVTSAGCEVPTTVVYWDKRLSPYFREWVPIALGEMMMQRSLKEWQEKFPYYANTIIAPVALGFEETQEPRLKSDLGAMLECLFRAFPDNGLLFHPLRTIDTMKLREEVKGSVAGSDAVANMVVRLNQWSAMPSAPSVQAGAPNPLAVAPRSVASGS